MRRALTMLVITLVSCSLEEVNLSPVKTALKPLSSASEKDAQPQSPSKPDTTDNSKQDTQPVIAQKPSSQVLPKLPTSEDANLGPKGKGPQLGPKGKGPEVTRGGILKEIPILKDLPSASIVLDKSDNFGVTKIVLGSESHEVSVAFQLLSQVDKPVQSKVEDFGSCLNGQPGFGYILHNSEGSNAFIVSKDQINDSQYVVRLVGLKPGEEIIIQPFRIISTSSFEIMNPQRFVFKKGVIKHVYPVPVKLSVVEKREIDPGAEEGLDINFIEDVTIVDNTQIDPGVWTSEARDIGTKKVWRIQNSGIKPWLNFSLEYDDKKDEHTPFALIPEREIIPLKPVYPGEIVDVSVDLKAPEVPYPMSLRATFKMIDQNGDIVFKNLEGIYSKLFVQKYTPLAANPFMLGDDMSSPTLYRGQNDACDKGYKFCQMAKETNDKGKKVDAPFSSGQRVETNSEFYVIVRLKNTGVQPWENRVLKQVMSTSEKGDIVPESDIVPIRSAKYGSTIAPGQIVDFPIKFTAPSAPGKTLTAWKIFDSQVKKDLFPNLPPIQIQVTVKTPAKDCSKK